MVYTSSEKTKFVTYWYVRMNPEMDVHKVFRYQENVVSEHTRVTFSQLLLSSYCFM